MTYGKGIASPPTVDGDIWDIFDGSDRVARFDHTLFGCIQPGAPVYFSLPLAPGGLARQVWLQSAVDGFVALAIPPSGATGKARQRLEAVVIDALVGMPDGVQDREVAVSRLTNTLVSIRVAAEGFDSQRLSVRSLAGLSAAR